MTAAGQAGDTARLRAATAIVDEIAREIVPEVMLTENSCSRAARHSRRRPARIFVSREAVDAGTTVLRGEVAHEYPHLIDALHRRDMTQRSAIVCVVGPFAIAAVWSAVWLPRGPGWLLVALWLTGLLLGTAIALWTRHVSYRIELRADRAAVELVGSVEPVVAMLDRFDGLRADHGLPQRIQAWLTHPSPERRRRALTAP